ncbi:MAG: hypothetical protein AAGG08_18710 [Actinomycetota bacterium]
MREWLIYVAVMAAIFAVLFRDNLAGALAGLLVSGPLYLAFGFVLAKFGYQRKTMKDLREARLAQQTSASGSSGASSGASSGSSGSGGGDRARPAPTSRTSTGRGRPGTKPNRRRR